MIWVVFSLPFAKHDKGQANALSSYVAPSVQGTRVTHSAQYRHTFSALLYQK